MQFPPRPYNNCMPTIVLCKYVLAIALMRIVYHLSLCKLVTKVNYNMFQSQSFRMWWSHAATRKTNDCRNYTCIRKTQTNQSCGSAGGIKFKSAHPQLSKTKIARHPYQVRQVCGRGEGALLIMLCLYLVYKHGAASSPKAESVSASLVD